MRPKDVISGTAQLAFGPVGASMATSSDQVSPASVLRVAATNYPRSPSRSLPVVNTQTQVPSGMTTV